MKALMLHLERLVLNNRTLARILTILAMTLSMLLLATATSFSQCTNYCSAGSFTYTLYSGTPTTFCFNVADGESQTICLEIQLQWQGGGNCNPNATVTLGIYNQFGQRADSACPAPMQWTFTAQYPPGTGACPSGQDVRCCCFNPEDYYIKITDSNGNDYTACYSGYIKGCITCRKNLCP